MGNSELCIVEHLGQCCSLYKVMGKWLSKTARIVMQENISATENGQYGDWGEGSGWKVFAAQA